jgi:prepilin-type N-terminal cleavage/methylation domain-containing protein
MSSNRAFTLLELLVVITIIGILASIVVVSMSGSTDSATIAKGKAYAQQVHALLGSNAVGVWNFDEGTGTTLIDISGYGNNGTLNKGANGTGLVWVDSDIEGSAIQFDGVDDWIDCGNDPSLRNMGSAVTVEAWAKYNGYGDDGQSYSVIIVKGSPWTFLLENPSNKIRFRITVGGVDSNAQDPTAHELNRWYHFVGTYDGSNVRIYKDGIQVGITPRTGAIATNDVTAKIGTYTGTTYNFNGILDGIRIYAEALPATGIQKRYVQGLNKLLANQAITQAEYDQRMREFSQYLASI